MNRIGGKSNTGEGGEDPARFADKRRHDVQLDQAGGVSRFGVTTDYLVNAESPDQDRAGLQARRGRPAPRPQGDAEIARLRHATPGVELISPPPHHDIYSIEDLAQLIHDLKRRTRGARIGVKLVGGGRRGTVAAGVAKAHADYM